MVYFMENLIKIDDLGGLPLFLETPKWGWEGKSYIGIQTRQTMRQCLSFSSHGESRGLCTYCAKDAAAVARYLLLVNKASLSSLPLFLVVAVN